MSILSNQKLLSGKSGVIGQGREVASTDLDPSSHEGAVVRGTDKLLHYSDGEKWIGIAPVQSTLLDAGNAATEYTGGASIDLGSAQS